MYPTDKPIPAARKLDYTPWEMPDLTGIKRSIAKRLSELESEQEAEEEQQEEVQEVAPPTEEDIAQLIEEAKKEGYKAGFSQGQKDGYAQGQEEGYDAGLVEGKSEGFNQGEQEGLAAAADSITKQQEQLAQLINQLSQPLAQQQAEVEQGLLSLVDQICRHLLRREVTLNNSHLSEVLHSSLAALPSNANLIKVFCHPKDLSTLQQAAKLVSSQLEFIPQPHLSQGGIKVETQQSLIDAMLESRYQKQLDQLINLAYSQQGVAVNTGSSNSLNQPLSQADLPVPAPSSVEAEQQPEASPQPEETLQPEINESEAELTAPAPISQGLSKKRDLGNLKPADTPVADSAAEVVAPALAESIDEIAAEPELLDTDLATAELESQTAEESLVGAVEASDAELEAALGDLGNLEGGSTNEQLNEPLFAEDLPEEAVASESVLDKTATEDEAVTDNTDDLDAEISAEELELLLTDFTDAPETQAKLDEQIKANEQEAVSEATHSTTSSTSIPAAIHSESYLTSTAKPDDD